MTKYVVAPDSFKESMTAKEVCDAMEKGIKKADPAAEVIKVPMADGGEGTVDSLVDATNGQRVTVEVTGPLGNKIISVKEFQSNSRHIYPYENKTSAFV